MLTRDQLSAAETSLKVLLADIQAQLQASQPAAATTAPTTLQWKEVYATDFVTSFEVNDKGIGKDGKPCWRSDFPYGGRIVNNGEAGLYADPAVFAGTNPFPVVNGKRLLRSERLAKPVTWGGKAYAYSAALMTAAHIPVGVGSKIEVRVSLPHVMRKGYWPGIWLLPLKTASEQNWPWPPEIDLMEWWNYNEGDKADAFWNTLHSGTIDARKQDEKHIALSSVGIAGDLKQAVTHGAEITSTEIICTLNGIEISRRPNPAPSRQWYPVLDLAVAGDPWPGAPKADTVFPQEVILESLKVSVKA